MPEPLTFFEWNCPECDHYNPIEDAQTQAGYNGVVVACSECKRRFKLDALDAHGFVFESKA
jgi:hypothetical protein